MSIAGLLLVRSLCYGWKRLALMVGGIAIGVLMLLFFFSVLNGVTSRSDSSSIRQIVAQSTIEPQELNASVEPLYVSLYPGSSMESLWRDKRIHVIRLSAGSIDSPQFEDLPTPQVGEYYISPGLNKIMVDYPEDMLGTRFGDTLLGIVPDTYVSSPDELLVVQGMDLVEAKTLESASSLVNRLYYISQQSTVSSSIFSVMTPLFYLAIFILILPAIHLIATASQLGMGQRKRSYNSFRLIGGSRLQARAVATSESIISSMIGAAIGFMLYIFSQPFIRELRFNDMRFWPNELTVSMPQIAIIITMSTVLAVAINYRILRLSRINTLSAGAYMVARDKLFRWWRLIPLLFGIVLTALLISPLIDNTQNRQHVSIEILVLICVITLAVGIVIAGPYIIQRASMSIARYAKNAETIISMKYISLNPLEVFRSISGMVVALFLGSFTLSVVDSMQNSAERWVGSDSYSRLPSNTALIGNHVGDVPLATEQEDFIKSQSYVQEAQEVKQVSYSFLVMPCKVAEKFLETSCPYGKSYIATSFNAEISDNDFYGATEDELYSQIMNTPYANISAVAPHYLVKIQPNDIDRLRTFLATSYTELNPADANVSLFDGISSNTPFIHPVVKEAAQFAQFATTATILITIINLTISTLGQLIERRHSLVALRLAGMTAIGLKRIITLQLIVPLAISSVVSVIIGILAGNVLITKITGDSIQNIFPIALFSIMGLVFFAMILIFIIIFIGVHFVANLKKASAE